MAFFSSFKDANGNSIFNAQDVVGFMSMHSVGGQNQWVGNILLTQANPFCGSSTLTAGNWFDLTPDQFDSNYFSQVVQVAGNITNASLPQCPTSTPLPSSFCSANANVDYCTSDTTNQTTQLN